MAGYNFNVKLHEGEFEVRVDTHAKYGYFEHDELGDECGGGLWFSVMPNNKLELVDCDGTYVLPKEVAQALRNAGFCVGEEFD